MTNPKCPHCGFDFDQDCIWHKHSSCEFPTESDGDEGEFDCPDCGEHLYVTLVLTPSWVFNDEDGDELHQQTSGGT